MQSKKQARSRYQAAIEGVKEVWPAVLASTATTVLVFGPILFIEQEAGQLYSDIAIAISGAIIYFNSAVLSHLLGHFEATGDEDKAVITRAVSSPPVAWQNIN